MAQHQVEIADAARRDLVEIATHLERKAGRRTAGRWLQRLEARVLWLAEFPYGGAEDDRLGQGRRRIVERPYLIVYRIAAPGLVRVLRIVHGARDVPALFGDNDE